MKIHRFSKTVRIALLALLLALTLSACSSKPGPTENEIQAELISNHFPAWWTIESFDVTVQENTGTEVEPVITSRFSAEIELQQDLYKPTATSQPVEAVGNAPVRFLADRRVIEVATEASTQTQIFGLARSTRRGEGWDIHVELESRPWHTAGEALADFGTEYVIAGTAEEAELIEQINAEWRAEQERIAAEEQRQLEEIQRLNEATLEKLSMGFADLVAEDSGSFVEVVAEFDAPGNFDQRFDFNVYFDGRKYTYDAVIRKGGIIGSDPDGRCQFLLAPEDQEGAMVGVSDCSLMPGDLKFAATNEQQLAAKFAESNQQLLDFFKAAEGGPVLEFRHRNLTFGGVDAVGLKITDIRDGEIFWEMVNRGETTNTGIWYVKYGKVRPRGQESAWWYLEYASPLKLEGRRYTNRPNRPIGMTLERSG